MIGRCATKIVTGILKFSSPAFQWSIASNENDMEELTDDRESKSVSVVKELKKEKGEDEDKEMKGIRK